MKETWIKIKEWWSNLAVRERQALTAGGSLLFVFIVYQYMWAPLFNSVVTMRNRIQTDQKTLVWMRDADKEIQKIEKQSQSKTKSVSPVVLLGNLQKQIKQSGLEQNLTQMKQASNDSIEMHFQKVKFDQLIVLLTAVVKEEKVSISQMSAIGESTSGLVNADIILKLT